MGKKSKKGGKSGLPGPDVWLTKLERPAATAAVTGRPEGTFVLRPSAKTTSGYVLTYATAGNVTNSKLEKGPQGFSIARGNEDFKSLEDLVYAAMQRPVAPLVCLLVPVGSPAPAEETPPPAAPAKKKKTSKKDKQLQLPASFAAAKLARSSAETSWGMGVKTVEGGGYIISKVNPGSVAEAQPEIVPFRRVLAINGTEVQGMEKKVVIGMLKTAMELDLVLGPKPVAGTVAQTSPAPASAVAPEINLTSVPPPPSQPIGATAPAANPEPVKAKKEKQKRKTKPAAASTSQAGPAGPDIWLTNLDRAAATAAVTGQPDGTFVLRPSAKTSAGYVCTWTFQNGVTNSKIEKDDDIGFMIAKGTDTFDSLEELMMQAQDRAIYPFPIPLVAIGATAAAKIDDEDLLGAQAEPTLGVTQDARVSSVHGQPTVSPVKSAAIATQQLSAGIAAAKLARSSAETSWGMGVKTVEGGGYIISKVNPGSVAEAQPEIVPFRQVLAINGTEVQGMEKKVVIGMLKTAMELNLVLGPKPVASAVPPPSAPTSSAPAPTPPVPAEAAPSPPPRFDSTSTEHFPPAAAPAVPVPAHANFAGPAGPDIWLTDLDRAAATAAVTGQPEGTFVLRPSGNASSGYVCTWTFQGGVTNSKLEKGDSGFSIARGDEMFESLEVMIQAAQTRVVQPLPISLKAVGAGAGVPDAATPVVPVIPGATSQSTTVTISRPDAETSWGMGVKPVGGNCFMISKIVEGGVASSEPELVTERIIDEINGTPILGKEKAEVIGMLKAALSLTMIIGPKPGAMLKSLFQTPGGGPTAVATPAASASPAQLVSVCLARPDVETSWGFGVKPSPDGRFMISKIVEGGVASAAPALVVDGVVNSINGTPTQGLTKATFVAMLKTATALSLEMAAAAAGPALPVSVRLARPNFETPWGFGVKKSPDGRFMISKIAENGVASGVPALVVNGVVDSINGTPTQGMEKDIMVAMLKGHMKLALMMGLPGSGDIPHSGGEQRGPGAPGYTAVVTVRGSMDEPWGLGFKVDPDFGCVITQVAAASVCAMQLELVPGRQIVAINQVPTKGKFKKEIAEAIANALELTFILGNRPMGNRRLSNPLPKKHSGIVAGTELVLARANLKTSWGLGFKMASEFDQECVVTQTIEGSIAGRHADLECGRTITAINGQILKGRTKKDVATILTSEKMITLLLGPKVGIAPPLSPGGGQSPLKAAMPWLNSSVRMSLPGFQPYLPPTPSAVRPEELLTPPPADVSMEQNSFRSDFGQTFAETLITAMEAEKAEAEELRDDAPDLTLSELLMCSPVTLSSARSKMLVRLRVLIFVDVLAMVVCVIAGITAFQTAETLVRGQPSTAGMVYSSRSVYASVSTGLSENGTQAINVPPATCGRPDYSCCSGCVGAACSDCYDAEIDSLMCCPPRGADIFTYDYVDDVMVVLFVVTLIAVSSIMYLLFIRVGEATWRPLKTVSELEKNMAAIRHALLGTVPEVRTSLGVTSAEKEVKEFSKPTAMFMVGLLFLFLYSVILAMVINTEPTEETDLECYDCASRAAWATARDHVTANLGTIYDMLVLHVFMLLISIFITYIIFPIRFAATLKTQDEMAAEQKAKQQKAVEKLPPPTYSTAPKAFDPSTAGPNDAAKLMAGIATDPDSTYANLVGLRRQSVASMPTPRTADEVIYAEIKSYQAARHESPYQSASSYGYVTVDPLSTQGPTAQGAPAPQPIYAEIAAPFSTEDTSADTFGFLFGRDTPLGDGGGQIAAMDEPFAGFTEFVGFGEDEAAVLDTKSAPSSRQQNRLQNENAELKRELQRYKSGELVAPSLAANPIYAVVSPIATPASPTYGVVQPLHPLSPMEDGEDDPGDPFGFLFGRDAPSQADDAVHAAYYAARANLAPNASTVEQPRIIWREGVDLQTINPAELYRKVEMVCDTPGAKIYYTVNSQRPTPDGSAGTVAYDVMPPMIPTNVGGTTVVMAIACMPGMHDSSYASRTFIIPGASPVVITLTPPDNNHTNFVQVFMSTDTIDAQIYYTVDGSAPIPGRSMVYDKYNVPRVPTNRAIKIKLTAIAFKPRLAQSKAVTKEIAIEQVEAPIIYRDFPRSTITMKPVTHDSIIYYSVEGAEPAPDFWTAVSSATLYDNFGKPVISNLGPTKITVRARAFKDQCAPSKVATAVITVDLCQAPTFATVYSEQLLNEFHSVLTLACPTLGATVLYSTNGQVPKYTMDDFGEISIGNKYTQIYREDAPPAINPADFESGSVTITALAAMEGLVESRPVAATFSVPPPEPEPGMETLGFGFADDEAAAPTLAFAENPENPENPYGTVLAIKDQTMTRKNSIHEIAGSVYATLGGAGTGEGLLVMTRDSTEAWGLSVKHHDVHGVTVSRILAGSVAARHPGLEKHRVISKVNGTSTIEAQLGDIMYTLKNADETLTLELGVVIDPDAEAAIAAAAIKADQSGYKATSPECERPEAEVEPEPELEEPVDTTVRVGCRCTVRGYECKGTVRFVGEHHQTGKPRVGVELDDPVGKHNGTVAGTEYFTCEPGHGVLPAPSKVTWAAGLDPRPKEINYALTMPGPDAEAASPGPESEVAGESGVAGPETESAVTAPGPEVLEIGSRCMVTGFTVLGSVRFMGNHAESGKPRIGVELDEAVGKSNGTVKGHEYFICEKKKGVLVTPGKVTLARAGSFLIVKAEGQKWGLGIKVDKEWGVIITKVKDDGVGAQYDQLQVNATLAEIQGQDARTMEKADVMDIMKESTAILVLPGPTWSEGGLPLAAAATVLPAATAADATTVTATVPAAGAAKMITMEKNEGEKWGMGIKCSSDWGVIITKVADGGVGARYKFKVGDTFLTVDGQDARAMEKVTVMGIMKTRASITVTMGMKFVEAEAAPVTAPVAAPAPAAPAAAPPGSIEVGSRVQVVGYECLGVVRFVGNHVESGKKRVGVELDEALGKHSGTVKGHAYFACAPRHGVLCTPSKVSMAPEVSAAPRSALEQPTSDHHVAPALAVEVPVAAPAAPASSRTGKVKVGARVNVKGYDCLGVVRFLGNHAESDKPRVGVELDEAVGKHNGTVGGHFYFECEFKKGVLPAPSKVTLADSAAPAAPSKKEETNPFAATALPKADKGGGGGAESVTLVKAEGETWGMSIDHDTEYGLKIKSVKPGGTASRHPEVRAGRSVPLVNGTDTKAIPKKEVKNIMKESATLEMTFGPDFPLEVAAPAAAPAATPAAAPAAALMATVPAAAQVVAAAAPAPSSSTPDYASMGRLALLKECRSKGLDTSAISKDKDALVALLQGGGGSSPPAAAAAAGNDDAFTDMGRMGLIRHLRSKDVDYSGATNVEELRELCRANP